MFPLKKPISGKNFGQKDLILGPSMPRISAVVWEKHKFILTELAETVKLSTEHVRYISHEYFDMEKPFAQWIRVYSQFATANIMAMIHRVILHSFFVIQRSSVVDS